MSRAKDRQPLKLWINRTSVRQSVSYLLARIRGIWKSRQMPSARPITLWLNIFIVMLSARAHGQEAVRMSLASEQAAAAQNPTIGSNYYNVQAGPVYLRFQGEMGMEFNDNVNYTES